MASYEVAVQKIDELLSPTTAKFVVPPFQRRYSWGDDQITQLIDDIFGNSSDNELPYFLGSIVLAANEGTEVDSDRSLVLDGQQRLTTISLVIAILIQKMEENGVPDAVMNKQVLFSFKTSARTPKMLLQERTEDRSVFGELLNEPHRYNEREFRKSRIGSALEVIYKTLEKHAARRGHLLSEADVYSEMLGQLTEEVEIVKITAPTQRDAFRLFETLNDRGLALSAADLIKNKLFAQCYPDLAEARDSWADVVNQTGDDNVVRFLRYYWMTNFGFVRTQDIFDHYRQYIDTMRRREAIEFARDIAIAAAEYADIADPRVDRRSKDYEVAAALERLKIYGARSCRPAILACSIFDYRESDRSKIVKMCESITVRYVIVGERNPNLLERIYAEICAALRNSKKPLNELFDSDPLAERIREVPNDNDFRHKLETMPVNTSSRSWREILGLINEHMGTGETTPEGSSRVHIEHILPQNPSDSALRESGLNEEEASELKHRIGNLTLLSRKLNQRESNNPFLQKKESYVSSEIAMTKDLAEYEKWTPHEIEARSRELTSLAVEIFPHPIDIVSARS